MTENPMKPQFNYYALSDERWSDLEHLFGAQGATGGCWCMWFRLKRKDFGTQRGELNRQAMHSIVERGEVPGIIAYEGNQPIGWCSIAPREAYPVLGRSPILKPIDKQPVWSIVCFFVTKSHRKIGLMNSLLKAAIDYAAQQGATIVEAYPADLAKGDKPDAFAFTGLVSSFTKAGFVEVARRSPARPIMRYTIDK